MRMPTAVRVLCTCAVLCATGNLRALAQDTPTPTPSFMPGTVSAATPELTTLAPTPEPTTVEPTPAPTTAAPTPEPTTAAPTPAPTTAAPTPEPTTAPPTPAPTTPTPTTVAPTPPPTTAAPTPAPTLPSFFSVNGTNSTCSTRIRRSWASLSTDDKQLYLDAVNASMVQGYHALFMELHSQYDSAAESHRTCGFLYWHRRFLYAYESMLRSLEPRFACLTVPYWDYYADFAKRMAGICTTFEGCSSFLQDFGGSAGAAGSNVLNGISASGQCASTPLLANFCHSSSASGSSCNRCMPRSDWLSKTFPSGFGYSSLAKLLSGSYGFAVFAQNLQYGTHNSIHNTALGAMGTMAMNADPIFYNHHATVDLVGQMWYECQVGRDMTDYEKQHSTYAFQQCVLSTSDVCPMATSNITQLVGSSAAGQPSTKAENHPLLAPFFSPLPTQYWQWVSGTNLGNFSYTYEKDVLFGILQASGLACPKNKIRRNLQKMRFAVDGDVRTKAVVKTFNLFQDVYGDALWASNFNRDVALEQVELMECQYYLETFGFVDDLTPEFKTNMRLPWSAKTICARYVQDLAAGTKQIRVSDWFETFKQHLWS